MNNENSLSVIVNNLDDYIEQHGQYWRHKKLSVYSSPAIVADKDFQGLIKENVLVRLRPHSGVLNHDSSSAFRIVFRHAKDEFILYFDIKHYYNSINFEKVSKFLETFLDENELNFIEKFYFANDGLRRGLFASPIISEIVGTQIDNLVSKILHEHSWKDVVKCSRYYDDLVFSGIDLDNLRILEQELTNELGAKGLEPNHKKTKILRNNSAKILGLRIHNGKVVVPKSFRNKLRLRRHYVKVVLENFNVNNIENVEYAMVAVGSVIGSIRYVINNSELPDPKFQDLLEKYCKLFRKLSDINDGIRNDENPFIVNDVEKSAISLISNRRHLRKSFSEEELAEIDRIIATLETID